MPQPAATDLLTAAALAGLLVTETCCTARVNRAASGSSPEIKQLYAGDQRDREGLSPNSLPSPERWRQIAARDAQRRERVRQLLSANALRSGEDYGRAAMIFQHGEGPNDYLFAHVLAMTALSKGHRESRWLAAATLDRYLQSQGQAQVFGTQYRGDESGAPTQAPYEQDLLPDALRREHCVAPYADQLRNVAALSRREELPAPDGCR